MKTKNKKQKTLNFEVSLEHIILLYISFFESYYWHTKYIIVLQIFIFKNKKFILIRGAQRDFKVLTLNDRIFRYPSTSSTDRDVEILRRKHVMVASDQLWTSKSILLIVMMISFIVLIII